MKNWGFHSLLRRKMIILPIITTSLIHSSLKGWENVLCPPISFFRRAGLYFIFLARCIIRSAVSAFLNPLQESTREGDHHGTGRAQYRQPGDWGEGKEWKESPHSPLGHPLYTLQSLHSNTKNVQYSSTRYRKNKERECVKSGYWVDLATCRTTMLRCKLQR